MHLNNPHVCLGGCTALSAISMDNLSAIEKICKNGGMTTFQDILRKHICNLGVSEMCCLAIMAALSEPEIITIYLTPELLNAVEECHRVHRSSSKIAFVYSELMKIEKIMHSLLGL